MLAELKDDVEVKINSVPMKCYGRTGEVGTQNLGRYFNLFLQT